MPGLQRLLRLTMDAVCQQFGSSDVQLCFDTPSNGNPCDDLNMCTTGNFCILSENGAFSSCIGAPVDGECDDDNQCTVADGCNVGGCLSGTRTPGAPCDDNNDDTKTHMCVTTVFCIGKPIVDSTIADPTIADSPKADPPVPAKLV
jgi:hypothetical protein